MMREKLAPWLPAIYCTVLSLITVIGNIIGLFLVGTPGVADTAFLCFLPMCFYLVGVFLSRLQQDNRELRAQLQEVIKQHSTSPLAAPLGD